MSTVLAVVAIIATIIWSGERRWIRFARGMHGTKLGDDGRHLHVHDYVVALHGTRPLRAENIDVPITLYVPPDPATKIVSAVISHKSDVYNPVAVQIVDDHTIGFESFGLNLNEHLCLTIETSGPYHHFHLRGRIHGGWVQRRAYLLV